MNREAKLMLAMLSAWMARPRRAVVSALRDDEMKRYGSKRGNWMKITPWYYCRVDSPAEAKRDKKLARMDGKQMCNDYTDGGR